MKITHATELMKNQKHAVIMAPDQQFKVLQTQEGHSLFLSIGSDHIFYCTREIPADRHGWSRHDYSSTLSEKVDGKTVCAKTFDLAQDLTTGTTDMALVTTVDAGDMLWVSLGNDNKDESWAAEKVNWQQIPFDDDASRPARLVIAEVYMSRAGSTKFLIVDIIADPESTAKKLHRYYIDTTQEKQTGKAWNAHFLAADISAGDVITQMGQMGGEDIVGSYTMGTIAGQAQLLYTPVFNEYGSGEPDPTRFQPQAGAKAMALSFANAPFSDLFVIAGDTLYFLRNDEQQDQAALAAVYTHIHLKDAKSLHVNNANSLVCLWGINGQDELFSLKCKAGSEKDSTAWSVPVPLKQNVQAVASMINSQLSNASVFVHTADGLLVQMMQDLVSTGWSHRNILLPAPKATDYVEVSTYTSHIVYRDDFNIPVANKKISITANQTCSVYVNDLYALLHTDRAVDATTDVTGTITIIQALETIGSICYTLTDGVVSVDINPMNGVLEDIKTSMSGSGLGANVRDDHGNSEPLVDSTNQKYIDSSSDHINGFTGLQKDFPENGQFKLMPISGTPFDPSRSEVTIMHFSRTGVDYHLGAEAAQKAGFLIHGDHTFHFNGQPSTAIHTGDAWEWLKHLFQELEDFFLKIVDGICHFVMSIADAVYHFVIRCVSDILQGIQFILNKLEIVLEKIIQWVGKILGWDQVVRTHRVFKKLFIHYANYCIDGIGNVKQELTGFAASLENKIIDWGKLTDDSYQNQMATHDTDYGQHQPSSNWATHHTKTNIGQAQFHDDTPSADTHSMFGPLANIFYDKDGNPVFSAIRDKLQTAVQDHSSGSISDLIRAVVAVIAEEVLQITENALIGLLGVAEDLIKNVVNEFLILELDIPVIGPLYQAFAGEPLSMLDLVSLVVATPYTIIYKLANKDQEPFPLGDEYNALTNSADLAAIAALCFPQKVVSGNITQNGHAGVSLTSSPLYNKLMAAGNICALGGSLLVAILGAFKAQEESTEPRSVILSSAYACAYIPYVGPDILGSIANIVDEQSQWWDKANIILAIAAVVKSFVDIKSCFDPVDQNGQDNASGWTRVSPWIDLLLNLGWQVPTTFAYTESDKKDTDLEGLIGNTFFNATGVMSPMIAYAQGEAKELLLGIYGLLNIGYGVCMVMTSPRASQSV